jgi:metal-responsive CopG/Arc/MetJ family transcriptional regulator
MKRTLVSLPDELFDIMRTKLKGKFGESDSEVIRGVVIAYLSEKGYLQNEEISSEYDSSIQEDTFGAIVDTLEEKGILSAKDIDTKMRKRLKSKKQLTKFEDLK